ncbi:MAG: head-tail adaptor protein [Sphingomonas sp.]
MSGRDAEFAGALRQRVTIMGGVAAGGAFPTPATRYAAVRPDGVGEMVAGEAASAAPRYLMTLRAGVEALPGDRVGWGARVLRVRGVIADPTTPDRIVLKVEEMR